MQALLASRDLPDTLSRKFRSYTLFAVELELADYVLIVRQGKPGTKARTEALYMVQEDADNSNAEAVAFLVAKVELAPKDEPEVYRCTVFPARREAACTCIGQNTKRVCKHADALLDACINP